MAGSHKLTTAQKSKVEMVMGEFSRGELYSSSGGPVVNRDQAIAIALRSAGVPEKGKK